MQFQRYLHNPFRNSKALETVPLNECKNLKYDIVFNLHILFIRNFVLSGKHNEIYLCIKKVLTEKIR